METLSLLGWLELWLINLLPLACYLLAVYYAYQLHRQPRMAADIHWHWSFLWLKLGLVGAVLHRTHSLLELWASGREGGWATTDPELLVAAWCLGVGLFMHVYLLARHPIWKARPPEATRP